MVTSELIINSYSRLVHLSKDSAITAVSLGMKVRLVPSLALLLLSSVIHVAEWVICA